MFAPGLSVARGQARLEPPRPCAALLCLIVLCAASPGCGGAGQFTWFRDLPRTEWQGSPPAYVIGVGDVLNVQVYEQPNLTTKAKIRPDGKIALLFIGEINALGRTPALLSDEIAARLKAFLVEPRVTVNVEETQPVVVNFLGEVKTAGSVTLDEDVGLLAALSKAGGPTEYADRSSIYVVRKAPEFRRIRFTYEALVQNQDGAATFPLHAGDVIVVE